MKSIIAYMPFCLLLSIFIIGCEERPLPPSHFQDDNILLEFRDSNGQNLFHDENYENDLQDISLYTFQNDKKISLPFKLKVNHIVDDNPPFSGIHTDQLKVEGHVYYLYFASQVDTLTVVKMQDEDQYQFIKSIYQNGELVSSTPSQPNRSHFILQR